MLLWDNRSRDVEIAPVSANGEAGLASKTVELIVVRAGGQPFGLLLKQIFNIARPEGDVFSVLRPTDPAKSCAEVFYQGQVLRVVELAYKLQATPLEALADSKILISGRLLPGGNIRESFGVSVDEIVGVWRVGLENLRLLDGWVCRKRLGRLLWGVALVDRASFGLAEHVGPVQPTFQFNDKMGQTSLLASSGQNDHMDLQGLLSLDEIRLARSDKAGPAAVPLLLVDLEVLRTELYRR